MSMRLKHVPALALAGLLVAGPVFAQAPAPAATPAPAVTAPSATAATPATTHRDVMVERRITELHTKLKITPAEQPPFDAFATAMRDNASRMDDAVTKRRAGAATATAVDQMKAYAELAQAHAEEVQHLVPSFSTLYDALSPAQKKMADQSFRDFSNDARSRAAHG